MVMIVVEIDEAYSPGSRRHTDEHGRTEEEEEGPTKEEEDEGRRKRTKEGRIRSEAATRNLFSRRRSHTDDDGRERGGRRGGR